MRIISNAGSSRVVDLLPTIARSTGLDIAAGDVSLFGAAALVGPGKRQTRATGIRETRIRSKLYRFQRDGMIGAIDKLQRFGGCILADSVGLGKTIEALSIC